MAKDIIGAAENPDGAHITGMVRKDLQKLSPQKRAAVLRVADAGSEPLNPDPSAANAAVKAND